MECKVKPTNKLTAYTSIGIYPEWNVKVGGTFQ